MWRNTGTAVNPKRPIKEVQEQEQQQTIYHSAAELK